MKTKRIPISVTKRGGKYAIHGTREIAFCLCARDYKGFCGEEKTGILEISADEDRERNTHLGIRFT